MDRMQNNIPVPPPIQPTNTKEYNMNLSQSKEHFRSEVVSTPKRIFRYLISAVNALHHMLAAVVVFYAIGFAVRNPASFALQQIHIILCVTGYQLIIFEGIMALNKWNKIPSDLTYKGKRALHLIIQSMGCLFVVTGVSIQIYNRGGLFQSAHGIFGLISLMCTISASVSSLPVLFSYRISIVKPSLIKVTHLTLGVAAFTIGTVTLCLGLNKTSFRGWSTDIVANSLITFTAITIVYTLIWPLIHICQYVRKSF